MPELGRDDKLISRKEASRYLIARGMNVTPGYLGSLAKHKNAGGGPAFYKAGDNRTSRTYYSLVDLELWRRKKLKRVE